jgi:hypothetical protein
MSYPFPYALGICAATLAFLAACLWLIMLCMEAAAAYLNRLDNRAAARKRAEAARLAAAQAAEVAAPAPIIPPEDVKRHAALFNARTEARLARAARFNVRNS